MTNSNCNITTYFKEYLPQIEEIKKVLAECSFSDFSKYTVFPGFCDVHVHFREPGFSYKETIFTGSLAAAHGGYTAVCTMPNLNPVPDSSENLRIQKDLIQKNGFINIYPYGALTVGEKGEVIADLENMANDVVAFSDDGRGVQNEEVMREAMIRAKKQNKIVAAHCEDNSLLMGGYIHKGRYALQKNHRGICSESEWKPIERDIKLARETGAKYHVCHISCKESVELIRKAKADGVDITCETAPHYLILDETYLREDGAFKMNPPLRETADRMALLEGVSDGTIDMIATDHAPHSAEEKSRGLEKSAFGIVGLESAFQLLYTNLVLKNIISLEKLLDLMCVNPRARFNIPFEKGFTVWNLSEKAKIDTNTFLSKGKSTPFDGAEVFGKCVATFINGKAVYKSNFEN